ncbi:malto-oligosyltrehalose synthase [Pseudomonas sp. CFBP 13719]|uniref:malto-oligosyltrehalose synthase n=1 Tax=Pseudomonas sp. CFBP 13719 TaxID=2775303 RepID=UPI001781180E|nr:malto-oligosyltrehalose synthase [Pseudomonas sp. CFBP 13719]MBD8682638.1 malto-oligosyltrehalose synthase [Pseudomonas sp. CFBP 13719]
MKKMTASVRLQLHKDFTLDDAARLVPYFSRLGISHVYASPILKARPGSMHGYDVVDPTQVNPELGGQPALERLIAALREHDMGFILDIVSNHMAVGGAHNPWWLDLLEWGRRSPYSEFFDIQWHSPDPLLEGQLLLPFLGSDYGAALQAGELVLKFDAEQGSFFVEHYEHRFPICPIDYPHILAASGNAPISELGARFANLHGSDDAYGEARALQADLATRAASGGLGDAIQASLAQFDATSEEGFKRLHELLERQSYRLASWRTAGDDINWRRFFDVNELGGLRVERPAVFEATHAKIFELIGAGLVDGLRIDHIDGLADPRGYSRKLRRRVNALLQQRPESARIDHVPIYVEKILGAGETLHRDWQVDGTTGYEFMNQVSLLQHDPAGEQPLGELWSRVSGRPSEFIEEAHVARNLVLNGSLAGDFESVAQALLQVARGDLMSRDLTLGAIRRALQELIVHFPVYRTYINPCGRPAEDEAFFQKAMDGARGTLGEADWPVLDYLQRWLGGERWRALPIGRRRKLIRHACVRFQQLTSPAAAKAVEDTAFYRSAVLLSRNDVGFETELFAGTPEGFDQACQQRLENFPDNLLATATHDHKRGEDTRTRLAVLSERAPWYVEQVQRWLELAAPLRSAFGDGHAPSGGDELMLYQALLGSWPLELRSDDVEGLTAYAERLYQWQQKALREAKLISSWSAPNEAYEKACRDFLEQLLLSEQGRPLRDAIAAASRTIAPSGALDSLVQTLLRMTVPGIPDLYQGAEYWDFSLVDPDNRRPVDYAARERSLDARPAVSELLQNWHDGRIKQAMIQRTLQARAAHPALFRDGSYQKLDVQGVHAERIHAFARVLDGATAVVIVPRLASGLLGDTQTPLIEASAWGDTRVVLPSVQSGATLKGLFSDHAVTAEKELLVSTALKEFPVNLFLQSEL